MLPPLGVLTLSYEGPMYWYVVYRAVAEFGDLMRDAAKAKAAMQDVANAAKAESAAEVAGATQAAAARQKDIATIQQETQALSQLANAAKNTNVQLLYGGRNTIEQHLSDMAQELNYTTLLNRQKWLGFSSVQQAMAYRQQMYNLALLENRAHFAGYQTADQYLGFLQREISQTAALSAAIRDRSSVIAAETTLLIAHANALQGTHQTAGSLGEQLTGATALNAAIAGLPTLVTTRAELDTSSAMAELAAYRAALLSLPHTETTDLLSAATRLGGVPLTAPRETVPVTVRPDVDYAAVNRMLSQALSSGPPETVRAPLAIEAASPAAEALSAMSDETDALAEAMASLSDKAAVSADTIARFQNSVTLAAVDTRALTDGTGRLTAAEVLLGETEAKLASRPRRMPLSQGQRLQYSADQYALQEITAALRGGEISNAPGGYPLTAPMQLVARPEEEEDLWAGLSKYMTGGTAEEKVGVEGAQQAEQVLEGVIVDMQKLDSETSRPRLELEGGPEAVTEEQLLANELQHLNERATNLGVNFEEVEAARQAAESLEEDLEEVPREVDTVLVVDSTGAGEEVRDYSADIRDIEREVGTRADFEDTEAESGLSRYLAALIEAVQRKYEFYASFNDDAAKAELAGWISELEAARAEENRLSAGMGGASGGGGGGGPPVPPVGGAADEPNPDDRAAWAAIADELDKVDALFQTTTRDANAAGAAGAKAGKDAAQAVTSMVLPLTNGAAGWFGLLTQVNLFGGILPGVLGHATALHFVLDAIIETVAILVPAIVTMAAGLVAFGIAGSDAAVDVYNRLMAIHTVGDALNATIPPMTHNLENLHDQVRPQVWEIYGDAITVANQRSGLFNQLALETGNVLDKLAARITVDMTSAGSGLKTFLTVGADNLAKLGEIFDNIGKALMAFIKVTEDTHVDQIFLSIFVALSQLLVLITKLPTPLLAAVVGLHAFWLWGGLLATVAMQLLNPLRSLALALGAVDAASVEGGLASLTKDASAWQRLKAGLTDIGAGFGALPARLGLVSKAADETAVAVEDAGTATEEAGVAAANAAAGGGGFAALLSRFNIFGGAAKATTTAAEDTAVATEDVGTAATEAAAGGGGLIAMLGRLGPALVNPYVALGLVATALAGTFTYLAMLPDPTQKWIDSLNQALSKASAFTVVSQTVGDLAAVTQELAKAQATGTGNATELSGAQRGLNTDLSNELTHVGQVSKAYGTDFVGALELLNAAGVKTSDIFTAQGRTWQDDLQQVEGLVQGYKAMGQGLGELQNDVSVQLVNESDQVTAMGKLNQAWDTWTSMVAAPVNGILATAGAVQNFISDATQAGASMTGLAGDLLGTTKTVSNSSVTLQTDFQNVFSSVQTLFDAMRTSEAVTGSSGFDAFVKDAVSALIPLAQNNKAAAAEISALAQEAGGPATTNLAELAKWAGNVKDPMDAMYQAAENATIATSDLSQDAQRLTSTLQQDLNPAMASAIFNAHGGQGVFNAFADSLAKSGPSSGATIAAARNVATELLAVSGNSTNAKANFVGFAEAMGLNSKQADQLWAQASSHITANLAQVRKELAKTASSQANIVKPGEVDTILSSFKTGTFFEGTFLAWIPQVQRVLTIVNHDVGQFFAHDIPVAFDVTSHAFMAAWDGMVNWFSQSVPHGLEVAWDTVSTFFDKAFTHDIPEAWDTAWSGVVSPVTHAFDDVKNWVSSNFDNWWKTHGSAVEAIWNALWGQIRDDAFGVWHFIESDATTAWHVITAIFTSGPAKQFWAGFSGAAADTWHFIESEATAAWSMAVAGARATWSEIEALAKAAWDVVAALAKAAWDIIWQLVGSTVKSAADIAVASFKVLWDQAVALAKIAWDTIVLIIDEVIDLFTGHWQTAWDDLKAYAIQVWNALKTAAIQTWNAISTAATQTWNAIWGAIKTAAVQVWNALKTGAEQAWTTIWHSMQTTFVNPMASFFTSTVPKWWDSFANFASQTWSKVWTGFEKDVLQPVENWFTSTLPNAMWNSLKGGIDHVISGLNTVIGWINAVTSIVGVHISPISMLAAGGVAPSRMAHGSVPGTGDEDGTHIIAMGGEYILRKPARMALQAAYGPQFLDELNQADSWLGSGSRGSAATQQRGHAGGRYASGGIPVISDIGNWLGDAGSAIAGAASSVWHGVTDAAAEVAKYGEKAVFDAMWSVSGAPAEKAMEALGTPGDMGAAWLQQIHNGVENYVNAQTAKAQSTSKSISGAGVSNASAEAALQSAAAKEGWTGAEWTALYDVEMREAGFSLTATNPSSGAYGMAQFINGAGEYAQYGGNSSTAAGQATAMVNYIAQRYGTPEAAWAHELAYGWYAAGGPVIDAIKAVTANVNEQEAMALGAWLLTRENPAGSAPNYSESGAWLINTSKQKAITATNALNATDAARFLAPYYAKAILGSTPATWKATPAQAALKADTAAAASVGTHFSQPSASTLAAGWNAVATGLGPAPAQTTAGTSTADTSAYQAAAAQLYPDWEGALNPWKTLSALKQPKGVSAADWASWLAQRAVIANRVSVAGSYIAPLFDDLKVNPQELTAAMWSHADSSVRRWQAAMDVASWAQKSEPSLYSPIQSNLNKLEPEIVDAANAWINVWGTTHTPLPGGGSGGTGGGTGTTGPGSGPGGSAGSTVIDLAPLITGGPAVVNAGDYGFNIASGGNVAAMFSGGLAMAAGGVVPNLFVPGLSANLSRQLTAAASGQLPRTLSDAAGNRVGLQVENLTISNPVAEKPSESITRASNRLAFLGGRGVVLWVRRSRGVAPPRIPVEARFWRNVERRSLAECWPWLLTTDKHGRGVFSLHAGELEAPRTGNYLPARVAFRLLRGHWPDPQALHGCDNPGCCNAENPEHIHEGTQLQNMREMNDRGRHACGYSLGARAGERHPLAKLTQEQADEMRRLAGSTDRKSLAAAFDISLSQVGAVLRGESYRRLAVHGCSPGRCVLA